MPYLRHLLIYIIALSVSNCANGAPTHLVLRIKAFTIERLYALDNSIVTDSGQYENCYAGTQDVPSTLPAALQDRLRCLWRNKTGTDEALWTEQWRKHGSCTGLGIEAYFRLAADKFALHDVNRIMVDSSLAPTTIDRDALLVATAAVAGARTWAVCDPPTRTIHISSVCMSPQPPHTPIDCPWGVSRPSKYDTECQGQLNMPVAQAQTVDSTCTAYILKTYESSSDGGASMSPPAPTPSSPSSPQKGGTGGGDDEDSNSSSVPVGAIVGGVIGGLAVVGLAVAGFLVFRQRHRRSENASAAPDALHRQQTHPNVTIQTSIHDSAYATSPPEVLSAGAWTSDGHASAAATDATRSTVLTDSLMPYMASTAPPAAAAAPCNHLAAWQLPYEDIAIERPAPGYAMEGVFKAAWNHTAVAVQVVTSTAGTASQDTAVGEVEAVAELLAGLRHPNIVQFLGYCTCPSCLVTEYVQKGSLCSVLAAAAADPRCAVELTWERRMGLAWGACGAMLFCHTRPAPIIHCAVSSMSLLIGANWTPKLAGFEHAYVIGKGDNKGFVGNPRWMSPQAIDGATPTASDDVYSFGMVLWELLTLQMPWGDAAPWTVVAEVQAGRRPPVPPAALLGLRATPPGLGAYVALMQRCWAQQPQDRPSCAEILAELKTIHPGLE